ncbi:hypothetical protein ABZX74_24125 [Streptomyces olivaceoviridis]|uniref:hypothetical protein n=1 Tax=Streptomyces olivaceoviridis TaxID=1921 RepID=UPI0033ABDF84
MRRASITAEARSSYVSAGPPGYNRNKGRTALEDRLAAEIDRAVEAADQAPEEPVGDLLKYVTSPEASQP